ncbi:hypothetical protein CYY_006318 [Polysphondylium violaceum]|uniref:Short-chain dehydrogenase/reductase family protein n=1 Tax=Polysphondylium violaceum TaxID=133409 RepID=A0A8J4PRF2_9MYCE|nr:hypothetical protein CYY_006318 [Polysphondylium violaceum]
MNLDIKDNNKVVFVTGVSSGLGLEILKAFLEKGFKVCGTTRDVKALEKVIPKNPNLLLLQVNVLEDASVQEAVNKAIAHFGDLHVLINNHGCAVIGAIEEFSVEELKDQYEINVFSVLRVIKAVLPHFRSKKSGQIITVGSMLSTAGTGIMGGYGSSKGALAILTESLAIEVKPLGIKVTGWHPGQFESKINDNQKRVKEVIPEYNTNQRVEYYLSHKFQTGQSKPEKQAQLIIHLTQIENPPVNIYIGSDSRLFAQKKIQSMEQSLKEWEPFTTFDALN